VVTESFKLVPARQPGLLSQTAKKCRDPNMQAARVSETALMATMRAKIIAWLTSQKVANPEQKAEKSQVRFRVLV
jgi:hypothetical protein